jgi:predicted glycosyltransferase involved in capsule biosynthesis
MKLSICTQLLDWNFGLKEALPTWLKLPCNEIVIFDWGNGKESAKEITDQYSDSRIKLIIGQEKIPYSHTVSRNTSIRHTTSDLIFFIDSDIKILSSTIPEIQQDNFMQGSEEICAFGTCIFWKKHFEQVNGFDERMSGCWHFDRDFYERLTKINVNRVEFPQNMFQHVNHDNAERVKNFEIKDPGVYRQYNRDISKDSKWDCNYKQKILNVKFV